MPLKDIAGQESAVAFIRAAVAHQRLPQALLFYGPANVGKHKAALALAQAINCAAPVLAEQGADGCGHCPACRRIAQAIHPDVEQLGPDGRFIKIDQIRAVTEKLTLNPYEAARRVVIVDQADRMNPEAANAFLKTLEEPPMDTVIVLVSSQPGNLPETIRSRCMKVRFGLLPYRLVEGLLRQGGKLNPEELDFAVRFSQGRLRPELLSHTGRLMALRDDLIHALEHLTRQAFEQVFNRLTAWSASNDLDFVLEYLETWFHDLVLLGGGASETRLINTDKLPHLAGMGQLMGPQQAADCHQAVLETRDRLALNANKLLALEALWLQFKQAAHPA